ncbi:MAG: hypothetical protein WCA84_12945 [Ignavibacteriaceae bacterium]|jgi:hypothetical protein
MKYLIIFLVVISLPLFARDKRKNTKVDIKIQMTEWMAKICSDPELREEMIEMILDGTKGNKNEMTKFGITIMDNSEMKSIITDMLQKKPDSNYIHLPSIVITDDSVKTIPGYKLSTLK